MESFLDNKSSSLIIPSSISNVQVQVSHGQQRESNGNNNVGSVDETGATIFGTCAHGDDVNLRSDNNVNHNLDLIDHIVSLQSHHVMDTALPTNDLMYNTQNDHNINESNDQNIPPLPHQMRLSSSPLAMNSQTIKFEMDSADNGIDVVYHQPSANGVVRASSREDNKDVTCGLGSLRCPPFLESKFANKKTFLIIFCITSVLQGMYQTYFVSILTTIEKLYQIQSKTIGIIMSATEISQIIGSLFLTYYAGQGNRPKWIGIGIIVFAVSSLLTSAPHFMFHDENDIDVVSQTLPLPHDTYPFIGNVSGSKLSDHRKRLCNFNNSSPFFSSSKSCDEGTSEAITQSRVTTTVLIIFFFSRFMIGIGQTALNTLGISFLDDNVAPKESPLYFGITIGVKIFGPVLGFLLGSICTSVYVDFPFDSSRGLDPTHPDWIGAWWLGALVVGFSLLVISIPMLSFPKRLPSPDPNSYCHKQLHAQTIASSSNPVDHQRQKLLITKDPITSEFEKDMDTDLHQISDPNSKRNGHQNNNVNKSSSSVDGTDSSAQGKSPSIKHFPVALKRLLKNEILLLRAASTLLHMLPIAGLYTFLPKYLESQFQLTASKASAISGLAGILVMGVGIFSSGIIMRKFKLSVRFVAAWIAVTALLYTLGMVILMTLGCPMSNLIGLNAKNHYEVRSMIDPGGIKPWSPNDGANPHQLCSNSCSCSKGDFAPICTSSGVNYISPCVAGCMKSSTANISSNIIYSDCKCLDSGVTAVNGYCDQNCGNLFWYIIIFSTFVLIHSTSEVGSMLLTLRCVEPQDKSMALGLITVAVGLFGNVPCSIIYGAVVDSTCLFWESNCDSIGACRIYDPDKFRLSFHGLTAFIMLLAFIVDAIVWYKSSHIKFDEEENERKNEPPPLPITINDGD